MRRIETVVFLAILLLAFHVTARSQNTPNLDRLRSTTWQWVKFQDPLQQFSVSNPEKYTLAFGSDGAVSIGADCNRARGNYDATDAGAITIKVGPMTRAMCAPGSRSDDFVKKLEFVALFFFRNDHLFMDMKADGGTFEFQPASANGSSELYMPRNVKPAYRAGFRSMDGRPGPRYFQNKSVHNIRISVTPPNRAITGSEDITYTNNGPAPLSHLYFRFELNVHDPEAPREKQMPKQWLTGDVVVDEYAENGTVTPYKPLIAAKGVTLNAVKLKKPIPAGGSVQLSFKWHYTLAEKVGAGEREGVIDDTSYFIAYFYPRVAVLDDVNNWDNVQHMLAHEFYGDFNDYTFEVTVPKNYVVWATGELQNIDEVLQPRIAERLKKSFTSDEIVNIASLAEMKANAVTAQNATNTWRWKANNVSDIAFGLSDHYIWDASSLIVDKKTGRRASTQAAYDEPSKNFANMVQYIKQALDFASNDWPGVPYPYPKMTIFRGYGDMEFPMMANDSAQDEADKQGFVAAHEILHTYFPFFMGINERRYGFMEEGWTTAFEYLFNSKVSGKEEATKFFADFRVKGWITSIDPGADIPIMTPEDSMTGQNYVDNKYGKAALGYLALKDLLGDAEFKRALHEFIARWHGKHPIPWDMFNTFNDATGKNLNWFFDAWFFSWGYIDFAVTGVTSSPGGSTVSVKNLGGYPAPFDMVITFGDGTTETLHQTPAIWQTNLKEANIDVALKKPIKEVQLVGGIFKDFNDKDNKWVSN